MTPRRIALCLFCCAGGPAYCAPPELTSLDPAGAAQGKTVGVTAAGTFDEWPVRVWSSNPDVSGLAGESKGSLIVSVGKNAEPGTCWVRVYNGTGASQLRPFVVGVLPEIAEAEPNDSPSKPQNVTLPVVVNGKLAKKGDVDCYAVKLARGQTLVASLTAHETIRSPLDGVLQILSPSGTVIQQNHDYRGLDPQLVFTAPSAGAYVVRLFAFPAQPDTSIGHYGSDAAVYRLTLTTEGFVESFTPRAVENARPASLTLRGYNLKSQTYQLSEKATRFVADGAANGGSVRREPHPCFEVAHEPLVPPFTITSAVAKPAESKKVPILVNKGERVNISVEAPAPSPLRPTLRVSDGTGKLVTAVEPKQLESSCETLVTPDETGVLFVEIRDLPRKGGSDYQFLLRVTPAIPHFAPSIDTDRITVVAGKPYDLTVKINPKNGFREELDWHIVGLPDEITARPAGEAKSDTVQLRFDAAKPGFNGPFQITATCSAGKRNATTQLSGFNEVNSDFWMTVTTDATKNDGNPVREP